jgi:zinc transporter
VWSQRARCPPGPPDLPRRIRRHIYVLTVFSAIIVALIAGMWGMNVGGIPFGTSPNGFWEVGALMAAAIIAVGIILFRLRFL